MAADDSMLMMGVDELMQAPQPAPKKPRSLPSSTSRPAAPRSGGVGTAEPSAGSRIAGNTRLRRAMLSPSLALKKAPEHPQQPEAAPAVTLIRRNKKRKPLVLEEMSAAGPSGIRDPRSGPGPKIEIGPFWSMLPVPEKHIQLVRDLQQHYRDESVRRGLADMLSEQEIPLKMYEWFVSHFARDHRTSREVTLPDGSTAILDVHDAYRSSRWAVRKRHWDFFGKRIKVAFDVDGKSYIASVSQLNAYIFAKRFALKELILDVYDDLERHFEQGKVASEAAALKAAQEAAREAGLPEDAPLKRKRGRRRKPKDAPVPVEPVMLSEGSVTTRLSLQD
jgi:hypothetical protein